MMPCILLVDDEPVIMKVARTVLISDGYHLIEATGPEEAFARADSHEGPIDLLITDSVFQDVKGRDIAERIKLIHPLMKVLHISGQLLETLQQNGSLTPGAAFLQKPFLPKEFSRVVRALLVNVH